MRYELKVEDLAAQLSLVVKRDLEAAILKQIETETRPLIVEAARQIAQQIESRVKAIRDTREGLMITINLNGKPLS